MASRSLVSHSLGVTRSIASSGVENCHCTRLPSSAPVVEVSPAATAAV
jgi:hypothetical protein